MREIEQFKRRTGISDPTVDMLISYVDRGWVKPRDMSYVKTEEDVKQLRSLGVDAAIDVRVQDEDAGWRTIAVDEGDQRISDTLDRMLPSVYEAVLYGGFRPHPAQRRFHEEHGNFSWPAWCTPSRRRGYGVMTGISAWDDDKDKIDGKWQEAPEKLPAPEEDEDANNER